MAQAHRIGAYKEVTLQQLRSFCETAHRGSFKAAAGALGLAHPTVWQQVHALERQLGATLVEPHKRGCRLTEEGQVLARLVGSLVTEVDSLKRRFEEVRGQMRPQLTVATTQRTLIEDLSEPVQEFERLYPNVQLRFKEVGTDEVVTTVNARLADLGITPSPEPRPADPWLVYEPAYDMDLILLAPRNHPLARRRQVRVQDLAAYPLVNAPGSFPEPAVNAQLERRGVFRNHPPQVEARYTATIRHFVALGFGLGLVLGLPNRPPRSNLHERSMSRELGFVRMNLVWHRGTPRQGPGEAFADIIRQQLNARPRSGR